MVNTSLEKEEINVENKFDLEEVISFPPDVALSFFQPPGQVSTDDGTNNPGPDNANVPVDNFPATSFGFFPPPQPVPTANQEGLVVDDGIVLDSQDSLPEYLIQSMEPQTIQSFPSIPIYKADSIVVNEKHYPIKIAFYYDKTSIVIDVKVSLDSEFRSLADRSADRINKYFMGFLTQIKNRNKGEITITTTPGLKLKDTSDVVNLLTVLFNSPTLLADQAQNFKNTFVRQEALEQSLSGLQGAVANFQSQQTNTNTNPRPRKKQTTSKP